MAVNPFLSIAMTTYNGERFLREQLGSILAQTYANWELHICDDCSTDGTIAILNEYAQNDSRVHVHLNDHNLGFKKNFEKTISFCNGEYTALSDQDDIWLPNHLEFLLKSIGKNALSSANAVLVDSDGKEMGRLLNEVEELYFLPEGTKFLYRILFKSACIQGASQLIRTDFLKQWLPIPEKVAYHDAWFSVCALLSGGLSYSFDVITKYRQHGSNITFVNHNKIDEALGDKLKRIIRKFFGGIEVDRFAYRDELEARFGRSDKNFSDICSLFDHLREKKTGLKDIKMFWKNYEIITTMHSHRHFIKKMIGWLRWKEI